MIGTDLTKGKVSSTLLRFTLPFLVSNVLHTLYSIVDMFIVGRFADPVQLSAVSIGSLLMMIVNSLLMGFSAGGTVVVGHSPARSGSGTCARRSRDDLQLLSAVRHRADGPLPAAAPPAAAAHQRAGGVLRGGDQLLHDLRDRHHLHGCFVSIAAVLRGMGDSKGPTVFITISCVANIIGDYLCVGVLQMGAAGAALATSASQGLSVVVGLIYLRRRNFPFSFRPSSFRIYRGHLGRRSPSASRPPSRRA
jgi:Na+-driven multidrug efflux pump